MQIKLEKLHTIQGSKVIYVFAPFTRYNGAPINHYNVNRIGEVAQTKLRPTGLVKRLLSEIKRNSSVQWMKQVTQMTNPARYVIGEIILWVDKSESNRMRIINICNIFNKKIEDEVLDAEEAAWAISSKITDMRISQYIVVPPHIDVNKLAELLAKTKCREEVIYLIQNKKS